MLAIAIVVVGQASAAAQPAKPLIVPRVPPPATYRSIKPSDRPIAIRATPNRLVSSALITRPGVRGAARFRTDLLAANLRVGRKKMVTAVVDGITFPGINRVNGATQGVFEPGGEYEVTGSGFGRAGGYAFVRTSGRMLQLTVKHWIDDYIVVQLPDDIAGLNDGDAELDVAPEGKATFKWPKFGFRAARVDQPLAIDDGMFRSDPVMKLVPGTNRSFPAPGNPDSKSFDGEYLTVHRDTTDRSGLKLCVEPGVDRIRWHVPLNPGFEVTGYFWGHDSMDARKDGSATTMPRGAYSADWDGDDLRINYGATRFYQPPFVLLPSYGSCHSAYRVKLIVTGPRGLPPR